MLDFIQARQYRTMEPAALQTCKQIYLEAVPILYSGNVFRFNHPDLMLRLIVQSGYTNEHEADSFSRYLHTPERRQGFLVEFTPYPPRSHYGYKECGGEIVV